MRCARTAPRRRDPALTCAVVVEAGLEAREKGDRDTVLAARSIVSRIIAEQRTSIHDAIVIKLAKERARAPEAWREHVPAAAIDCARLLPAERWIELERLPIWGRA